ncbi:MAG: hypothetical protein WC268_03890 [Patescibacteria group bacterium]|jgi:uncharacterized membrane protein YjgN (DUF898 family)
MKKLLAASSLFLLLGLLVLPNVAGAINAYDLGLNYGTGTGLTHEDLRTTASSIINIALSLLGIIAVVIVIVGGVKWMLAGGNEEKTGEAKNLIGAGVIGLVIILCAYAIAAFVINSLVTATGGTGTF